MENLANLGITDIAYIPEFTNGRFKTFYESPASFVFGGVPAMQLLADKVRDMDGIIGIYFMRWWFSSNYAHKTSSCEFISGDARCHF